MVYYFFMKKVPLKDLKLRLSLWMKEAAKGSLVQVTRYNRPYIYLFCNESPGLHCGSQVGKSEIKSVLSGKTKGRWLEILLEDREDRI